MRVWEQNIYFPSPIPWFQAEVDLGAASWLVTRLESACKSVCCENRPSLVVGSFSIVIPFTNLVECISSMLWAGVERYILQKTRFCFLNGAINKNRTKPSCQVKRLSKLKPACLTYSCSFVLSATRRVLSFVDVCLCHARGCTVFASLPPAITPTHWHCIK